MPHLYDKCVCLFWPMNDSLDSSLREKQLWGVRGGRAGMGWGGVGGLSLGGEPSCVRRLHRRPFGCFWRRRWHSVICFLSVVSFCHPSNRVAAPVCFSSPRRHVIGLRGGFLSVTVVQCMAKINGNCPKNPFKICCSLVALNGCLVQRVE